MPQFSPGESKTATAPIVAKPAGMNCEAELFLGPDDLTKIASSGRVPFVSTGAAKNVSLPITMPSSPGTLKGYIDVFAEGLRFLAYKTTEDVVILSAPLPPPGDGSVWGCVTDGITGAEVPNVQVTLDGLVCYTGNYGQYQFRYIAVQKYRITFSKAGYESVSRDVIAKVAPDWTELNISLPPIVPAKPTLVYAYPAPAQVATGFSPPNSVYINYKVGIPDITEGYLLIFLFGLEGIPWWVVGTPYPRFGCVRVVFAAGATAGYYEGSEQMYAKYSTGRFSSAHLLPGVYRLLSTCQLYREPGDYLVETYWSNVDTGEKITVV